METTGATNHEAWSQDTRMQTFQLTNKLLKSNYVNDLSDICPRNNFSNERRKLLRSKDLSEQNKTRCTTSMLETEIC